MAGDLAGLAADADGCVGVEAYGFGHPSFSSEIALGDAFGLAETEDRHLHESARGLFGGPLVTP
jgi:hypothetical protein